MGATTSGTVSPLGQATTMENLATNPPKFQPMDHALPSNYVAQPISQPQQAFSQTQGNVFQQAAAGLNQAMAGTQQGMMYAPMNVGVGNAATSLAGSQGYNAAQAGYAPQVNAQNVQAGQIAGTNLGAYMNPYESQVVQSSLSDIDRARQMQANDLAAQATRAGAFGGSRAALMQSELGRNALQQAATTSAGLRQAGFQNAQQLAGQDIAARMQADLANQGANLQAGSLNANLAQGINLANQGALNTAGQFGASAANQAALANQAARNQMAQYNVSNQLQAALANQSAGLQGANMRLGAANQMGNLANLGFGIGQQTQAMQAQSGALSQAVNQALIDAAKAQYAGYTGAPAGSLSYMASALGATPGVSTTTQSKSPGLFDYLTLAALA